MPRYIVRLTEAERVELEEMLSKGRHAASKAARARILLKADEGDGGPGWKDGEIVKALDVGLSTVHRVRQAFVESGLAAALHGKPGGHRPRKLDGEQEARLVALACGPAPEGRARWTLKLLADRLVELEVVGSVSAECVRATLKKTNSNPGSRSSG